MTLHGGDGGDQNGSENADITAKPDPYVLWRNPNYRYYAGSWFLITFSRRVEICRGQLLLVNCTAIRARVAAARHPGIGAGLAGDIVVHPGRANRRPFQPTAADDDQFFAGHRLGGRTAGRRDVAGKRHRVDLRAAGHRDRGVGFRKSVAAGDAADLISAELFPLAWRGIARCSTSPR